ncbi:MAG TPA: flagellar hook protein FlgE [Holophaga sp.]|nr:flagellar hook protein FlgE [Holophaga sp.]
MSIYSSFYSALSGLSANGSAMSVIGNNLANLNTIGYKGSSATFQDLFASAMGGSAIQGNGNPNQIGMGTSLGCVTQNFASGSTQSTSSATDMAIQGNGFFVLQTQSGGRAYSRAGNFTLDVNSNLVNPAGYEVLGWLRTGSPGTVDTTATPTAINLSAYQAIAATPTQNIAFTSNLDASSATAAVVTNSIDIYDSLGNAHSLQFNYTKTGTNTWTISTSAMTGGTITATSATGGAWSGTLTFNSDGTLASSTIPSLYVVWANGSADQSITYDPSNLAQTASASVTSASTQDGMASGTLDSYTVSQDGEIIGAYTNGQNIAIAQVSLAMFTNVNGLQKSGNNCWTETIASGTANIAAANVGGRGYIEGSSLELSNVDTATELTQMIVTQQGYQANSRVITTANTLLQEVLNLGR